MILEIALESRQRNKKAGHGRYLFDVPNLSPPLETRSIKCSGLDYEYLYACGKIPSSKAMVESLPNTLEEDDASKARTSVERCVARRGIC